MQICVPVQKKENHTPHTQIHPGMCVTHYTVLCAVISCLCWGVVADVFLAVVSVKFE